MAGPVFVLDAEGRPLMPLAEAHARKLLQSGKARRRPHPTLTIIQLSRSVEQPILRPILLGIAFHPTAAELFLLAAGPQVAFPLLSIVVILPQERPRFRGTTRGRPHKHQPFRRQLLTVGMVISYLWWLLPLSHIVVLNTPSLQIGDRASKRRLLRLLTVDELRVGIAPLHGTTPPEFPPELFSLLQAVAANPAAHMPIMVASVTADKLQPRLSRGLVDEADDGGIFGIVVVAKPPLSGISDCDDTDNARVLEIPIAAGPAGVVSRYVALAPEASARRWPMGPVVLLPLVSRAVQDTLTLWEKPMDAFQTFFREDEADASTDH